MAKFKRNIAVNVITHLSYSSFISSAFSHVLFAKQISGNRLSLHMHPFHHEIAYLLN